MLAALAASLALVSGTLLVWSKFKFMFSMADPDPDTAGSEDAQKPSHPPGPHSNPGPIPHPRPHPHAQAYILENVVTHARLLPAPSAHAFSYPTLALFVALDALEAGELELARGWLFGYRGGAGAGGKAWRVTGLRAGAYLFRDGDRDRGGRGELKGRKDIRKGEQPRGIKAKLRELLRQYGHGHGHDGERLGGVWMLTMPSYMGYEGINPLTVYYCYVPAAEGEEGGERERLGWVVLEIHNTFGEKHVHVLETGVGEDAECPPGYHHQWTFARDFHVSPFNDRLGHYTVSVNAPPAPSSPALASELPRPKIRIHLHAARPPSPSESASTTDAGPSTIATGNSSKPGVGPLKLTATLIARRAVPLTSTNLLRALARYPLALFLSFARILYHAWILHYVKRLDVFPRPDPKPAMVRAWGLASASRAAPAAEQGEGAIGDGYANGRADSEVEEGPQPSPRRVYGGIGWQDEGPLEAYARRAVERFLGRRASELGVRVVLESGDPSVPRQLFAPSGPSEMQKADTLVIQYAAARFFPTLMLAPCAAHMLVVGRAEDLFWVSSEELFLRVFAAPDPPASEVKMSWVQSLRLSLLPQRFARSPGHVPLRHPLDEGWGLANALVLCLVHAADCLEKMVFGGLKARFVPGMEPWRRWERAALLLPDDHS